MEQHTPQPEAKAIVRLKPDDGQARWLVLFAPAGFERFFEEIAKGVSEGAASHPDLFRQLAARHDVEFV